MSQESIREELLHRGSVKDIYRLEGVGGSTSRLEFRFSDRYSIFDWGTMPDLIPRKGEALARMGALFFEELKQLGVATHFLARGAEPARFQVQEIGVPRGDPGAYLRKPQNTLVPLEVIFRWGVPRGSSLLKRNPGLVEGQLFDEPLIEFTTKLERQDRLLTEAEAVEISGASFSEWNQIQTLTRTIAQFLKSRFAEIELQLWDGKLEFAFGTIGSNGDREIMLVDAIGIDELRLTYQDHIVSKELLRQFYLPTEWVRGLSEAKKRSATQFKEICQYELRQSPHPLEPKVIQAVSRVYQEVAFALEKRTPPKIDSDLAFLEEQLEFELKRQAVVLSARAPKHILVLGSGGREHALAWRLLQDPGIQRVVVMPGNPGMLSGAEGRLVLTLKQMTQDECVEFCRKESIDLIVVGPEKYLLEGWVEVLQSQGFSVFGVSKAAAILEGSKSFAKSLMVEESVPTARYLDIRSQSEVSAALERIRGWAGVVIKLSGPALGKGVMVTSSFDEAKRELERVFQEQPAGIEDGVVLEERLRGRESSLFFACLEDQCRYLGSACDYKRIYDQNQGPNTGGMGAVSPTPHLSTEWVQKIERAVVIPVLNGMKKRGRPYTGILFVGMMGESVLEFNARWGDPETQALLPLIQGNLSRFFLSMAQNDRDTFTAEPISLKPESSIHVVKAARGYPGSADQKVEVGQKIRLPAEFGRHQSWVRQNHQWFFAGITNGPEGWVSSGGRVLGLTVWGSHPENIRTECYQRIQEVGFLGEHFRKDIGINPGGTE